MCTLTHCGIFPLHGVYFGFFFGVSYREQWITTMEERHSVFCIDILRFRFCCYVIEYLHFLSEVTDGLKFLFNLLRHGHSCCCRTQQWHLITLSYVLLTITDWCSVTAKHFFLIFRPIDLCGSEDYFSMSSLAILNSNITPQRNCKKSCRKKVLQLQCCSIGWSIGNVVNA